MEKLSLLRSALSSAIRRKARHEIVVDSLAEEIKQIRAKIKAEQENNSTSVP